MIDLIQVFTSYSKGRFIATTVSSSLVRLGELLQAVLSSVFLEGKYAVTLHQIDLDNGTFPMENRFYGRIMPAQDSIGIEPIMELST